VEYTLTDAGRLAFIINALAGSVCDELIARGERAREMSLVFSLAKHRPIAHTMRTSRASADRARWMRLVRDALERLTLPDAVTGIALRVESVTGNEGMQGDLFDRGFASFGWGGQSLEELPASTITAAPDMRPVICGRRGPIPSEEETQPGPVEANASGNSDNAVASLFAAPSALSYAAGGDSAQKRTLGPRAYLPPIRVWAGRTPPTALAESEDADEKPAPARKASKTAVKAKPKSLSRTANTAAPAGAAHAAAGTPSIIEDGKAKGPIRPSVALSPGNSTSVVRSEKPKRGAIEAKRKPVAAAAAPAAKPAAAKPAPAKPKASVKTSGKPGPKNTTAPARAEASAKN
jgi:D-alanyl-D-alanine carboxypeptidase